jgi:pyridinium-3,5-biscarboxylic acid mononucleotide synthase
VRRDRVRALLDGVAVGQLSVDKVLDELSFEPTESLSFASIDHHRALRQGFPEVVFGQGKTPDQIVTIAERLSERGDGFLVTRLPAEAELPLRNRFAGVEINALGRTAFMSGSSPRETAPGTVLIVTAGTSDLPIAEEAAETARAFATRVERLTDVGVAGIHRLLARREELSRAAVVIVVAGMDGALPSVVGGLVRVPVIAVPTSVGYGASFEGLAALLTMLNSCASGVTVVNIDNGFGATAPAARIVHTD